MFKVDDTRHEVIVNHPALLPFDDAPSAEIAGKITPRYDYFFGHFSTSNGLRSLNSFRFPLFQLLTGREYPGGAAVHFCSFIAFRHFMPPVLFDMR